jgi:hypothetical protein
VALMRLNKFLLLGILLAIAIPRSAGQGVFTREEWIHQDCGTEGGFNAVWGFSRDEVYAVGMQGTIVKFDGRTCRPQVNGAFDSLFGVWGTSTSDIWAVGERGTIVHSDGGAWRPVQTNPVTESHLAAVWGTSHDDVFAVGENGTILHFDGASWAVQESGTQVHLWSIWGTSPHDVFVAGDGTTLLYYDGARWKNILADYPDIGEVRALWGSTGNIVWIIANAPRGTGSDPDSGQPSMDWGGVMFQVLPGRFPTLMRLCDLDVWASAVVAGSGGDAYMAAPPRLLHLAGSMSNVVSASTPDGIRGIWRTRMDEFFAVNKSGLFTYRAP